jgi:hypothetical protein
MIYDIGNHKLPSFLGAGIFGFLCLLSLYHLKLLNDRKLELAERSFGAQATLDEPFRRSLRAKVFILLMFEKFEEREKHRIPNIVILFFIIFYYLFRIEMK